MKLKNKQKGVEESRGEVPHTVEPEPEVRCWDILNTAQT
jgi:hypothetical protein